MKSRYSQGYNTEVCLDKGEERTIPVDSPAPRNFSTTGKSLADYLKKILHEESYKNGLETYAE